MTTSTMGSAGARGSNLGPPKILTVVIVVAVLAFWISLVAHFQDV